MRILLVRLRLIGDVVFTTPLLSALRRQFPDARLTYVVEAAAAPVLEHNPYISDLIVLPLSHGWRRIRDDLQAARSLGRSRFDIAIDLHGGPRSAWLAWASRAPIRIGYPIRGRSWMYTHVVPRTADEAPRHSVCNQWDLLTPLGVAPPDRSQDPIEIVADPSGSASVDARLRAADIGPATPLVVIHVSAGNPFRRWPQAAFEETVVALVRRDPRRRILLTAGPSDADAARQIADRARHTLGPLAGAVPDIGEFSLRELPTLVGRAAVYIGGDSGPLHIAASTHTPIVAILGPTLPERSMPWRDARWFAEAVDVGVLPCRPCRQRTCEPGDFRCLTQLPAERVTEAAERALTAAGMADGRHG